MRMETGPTRIRVIDIETGGNGPNEVCEIGWQDLRRGTDRVWRLDDERGALLVNPGRPMSPDTLAHRAGPDAYVTAFHLRDMLNEASITQLLAWSQEPGLLPRVPAGPVRGRPWADLDEDALRAFANGRDPDIRFSAQCELHRRGEDLVERPEDGPKQARLF